MRWIRHYVLLFTGADATKYNERIAFGEVETYAHAHDHLAGLEPSVFASLGR